MTEVITVETITPETAEKYIESNYENNRKLRQRLVSKYADDMEKGLFKLNITAPIVFSDTGKLIDGQHRLYACIQSNTAFESYVVRGADEALYKYIDIGTSRTAADQINSAWAEKLSCLAKYTRATRCGEAGIGSALQGLLKPATTNKAAIEVSKTQTIIEAETYEEELIQCLRQGERMRKVIKKWGTPIFAYFIWLVKWIGRDVMLDEYIDLFCDAGCTNRAINFVRTKMLQRAATKNIKTRGSWIVTVLLFSYDAYVEGREIKQFRNFEEAADQWNGYVQERRSQDADD